MMLSDIKNNNIGRGGRFQNIDAIKGFAIFSVVLGHLTTTEWLHTFIYLWHIPLFFLASGFLIENSCKKPFFEFIRKKTIGLLLPCITFIMLFTVKSLSIDTLYYYLLSSIHGGFWFLPVLFIFCIAFWSLYHISFKVVIHHGFSVIIPFFLFEIILFLLYHFVPQTLQDIFCIKAQLLYWPYFILGFVISRFKFAFNEILSFLLLTIFIVGYLLIIQKTFCSEFFYQIIRLAAVCGIYSIFTKMQVQYLIILGQESLSVYLLHWLFISNVGDFAIHYSNHCGTVEFFILLILSCIICFCSIAIKRFVCKSEYIKLVFFGQLK